jgi:alpha-tubulin suppressor-like RCC1 family protein
MTRGVTINQTGGTMVAGGETANIGFNTPIFNSGLPGTANYGYGASLWYGPGTTFITTEGKVYFGGNSVGQAGDGTTDNKSEWIESTPASSYPIVAFATGDEFAMALDSSGQLWAAGENGDGELGVGDTTDRTTWTANTSVTGTQAVSCGEDFTMRITSDGLLEATGDGGNYKNGTGTGANTTYFVPAHYGVLVGYTVKSVWAAHIGVFVIRSDNALCFAGYNRTGESGTSLSPAGSNQYFAQCTTTNFSGETPVQVSSCFDGSTTAHSMMITASGKIYGTGSGAYFKHGLGPGVGDVNIFTRCTGDIQNVTVTRVSTNLSASIALDSTGNVWIVGHPDCSGQTSTDAIQVFTKVTEPAEFYSKTIVNVFGGPFFTFYAVDSEGTMWGVGVRVRGLGLVAANGYNTKLFSKVPIYDVVPKEFKYTPTLTLENPNPDYGATIEFKNPNNRAFINLDDKTSNLRLGFVNNEDNAGQFKGISISPSDNSVYFNQGLNLVAPGDEGINFRIPAASSTGYKAISKFIGIRDGVGDKLSGMELNGTAGGGQFVSFYTHNPGVSIGTRMTIASSGKVGIGVTSPSSTLDDDLSNHNMSMVQCSPSVDQSV